jgi:hypothetical protein
MVPSPLIVAPEILVELALEVEDCPLLAGVEAGGEELEVFELEPQPAATAATMNRDSDADSFLKRTPSVALGRRYTLARERRTWTP